MADTTGSLVTAAAVVVVAFWEVCPGTILEKEFRRRNLHSVLHRNSYELVYEFLRRKVALSSTTDFLFFGV